MNTHGQILTMQRMGANPLAGGVPAEVVTADPRAAGLDRPLGTFVSFGTAYYEKAGTGTTDWIKLGVRLSRDIYRAKAEYLLGDIDDTDFLFDDFDLAVTGATHGLWSISNTGSGAFVSQIAAPANKSNGWCRLRTVANASTCTMFGNPAMVASATAGKGYFVWRFAINSAIDAQATCAVGAFDIAGTKTVTIGVHPAGSQAFFALQYDGFLAGSFDVGTVAVDTGIHVAELWFGADSKAYWRFDNGATRNVTQAAAPAASLAPYATSRSGTTNADRQVDLDFCGCKPGARN